MTLLATGIRDAPCAFGMIGRRRKLVLNLRDLFDSLRRLLLKEPVPVPVPVRVKPQRRA